MRLAALRLTGAHAVVVMCKRDPGKLIAFRVRNAGGILVGYGDGEMLLASDLPAVIPHTREVAFLSAGEMVSLTSESAAYLSLDGSALEKTPQHLSYDAAVRCQERIQPLHAQGDSGAAPGHHRHPARAGVPRPWGVDLEELGLADTDIEGISRVIFVAMGTSYNAALVARHMMEQLSGLPSEAEIASEFRYRNPILDSKTLVVSIGQSGETADTLSAMEEASRKGARLITVCNSEGSQATRLAEGCIYLRAGPEIGVASTKTFTCSLEALYLLAAYIGSRRGFLSESETGSALRELVKLPDLLSELVARQEPYVALAERFHRKPNFLYMGRGPNHAIALEGALKLKEIAYVHAEGCSAGEMKHGPIALIDEGMPVVAIAPRDDLRDKMLNSIFEVKARGATVIALATEGDEEIAGIADYVLYIPPASPLLTPALASVPLQLLAYHIAVKRGCEIDQPRNLAKSVTVE